MRGRIALLIAAALFVAGLAFIATGWNGTTGVNLGWPAAASSVQITGAAKGWHALSGLLSVLGAILAFVVGILQALIGETVAQAKSSASQA